MMVPAATRILLGLDACEPAETEIALAARLAESLHAAIHGLMVEEQGLIDAAALPFTRITARTGTSAPDFSTASLQRALGRMERSCRGMLSSLAQSANLTWTFQRERGGLAASLLARVETGDIVILPATGSIAAGRIHLADIRQIARRSSGVVVAGRLRAGGLTEAGPVVVLAGGNSDGPDMLTLAARIAAGRRQAMHVILNSTGAADAQAIEQHIQTVASRTSRVRFHRVPHEQGQALALKLRRLAPSLVVAGIEGDLLRTDAAVLELQRACGAPLLLLGNAAHVGIT